MSIRELKVSLATYDEIAGALEQAGAQINRGEALNISKSDKLSPPVDFRLVTIRRDIVTECSKVYSSPFDENGRAISDAADFLKFADAVYQYVLNNKLPTKDEKEI